jgi:hypothetical protein
MPNPLPSSHAPPFHPQSDTIEPRPAVPPTVRYHRATTRRSTHSPLPSSHAPPFHPQSATIEPRPAVPPTVRYHRATTRRSTHSPIPLSHASAHPRSNSFVLTRTNSAEALPSPPHSSQKSAQIPPNFIPSPPNPTKLVGRKTCRFAQFKFK